LRFVLLVFGLSDERPCDGALTDTPSRLLLDTNGDATVDASDAIYNLIFLFGDGPPPVQGTACRAIPGCPRACGASR
jgi:hypothetical protein